MPKAKLNMAAIKKAAKSNKVKIPKSAGVEDAAKMLEEHYKANVGEDKMSACLVCGFGAPDDEKNCPFCGTELGGTMDESKSKTKAKKQPAQGKGVAKKKKNTELAEPDPKLLEECKNRVDTINGLRGNVAEIAWDIGQELKEINEKNLWKHMGYKSFSQFCKAELEYTRMLAYMYIAVTKLPRETVAQIGVSKANIIANAPPRKQKKLNTMAEEGKTRKEMQEYLAKGKKNTPPPEPKITILGRVDEGDLFFEWEDEGDGAVVEFEIVTGVLLRTWPNDENTGLNFRFVKPGDVPPETNEGEDEGEDNEETSEEESTE